MVDKAVQCYPDEEKYFKTQPQAFPWFQIDLKETRVVFGLTVFFRDDAFKPPYSHFSNVKIFVLDQPLEGQITKEIVDSLEPSKHCYTLESPPTPRKHKLDIECLYALEGRYLGVIMNNNATTSYISLNEVVPILLGKHIFCLLIMVVLYQKSFCVTGKPFAFASSFINLFVFRYEPKYVIDKTTGNPQKTFKSVKERYPWLAIDFGTKITVNKVKFIFAKYYYLRVCI